MRLFPGNIKESPVIMIITNNKRDYGYKERDTGIG